MVLRGYRVKVLRVLGLIWLGGYRYIEFTDFLRLERNPDVLKSNGLQIQFQREKINGNSIVAFFAQKIVY